MAVAEKFKKVNKELDIKIIKRKKTYGLSSSYNLGAKMAKGDYLVTLHSDGKLPTKGELRKLINPFLKDSSVVATFPFVVHPRKLWLTYNFWQKCLFARVVDKEILSGNGKFDCYKKDAFLKLGGYDEERFAHTVGAEDADMHLRLKKEGKISPTKARVIHNHGVDKNCSLKDWLARRRFLAISYGRHLQLHLRDMKMQAFVFFIKPLLAFTSILSVWHLFFLVPVLLFPFIYMPRMFREPSTRNDPRILFVPMILIFFIYYETYWMLRSLLLMRKKV